MISIKCVAKNSNKIISIQENKCKLMIKNPKRELLKVIKVDGCAITKGLRCDYLVKRDSEEIFIELKGHDISHAKKQLESSIKILSKCNKTFPKKAFIVCNRSPMSSPLIQQWQIEFKMKYNSALQIKSILCEYSI